MSALMTKLHVNHQGYSETVVVLSNKNFMTSKNMGECSKFPWQKGNFEHSLLFILRSVTHVWRLEIAVSIHINSLKACAI